ncbi:MAG: AzlD domain-containing protein [Oscillospiraceae bacterium]|nr:AzlD domain-containing protein [Oscillospiraceae bacterium]
MNFQFLIWAILAMALVGYSIKAIPLAVFKKEIKNKFLSSFLHYIMYAVLTSMVVPEVIRSTSSPISALFGVVVAVVLGLVGQGLLVISLASTATVFIVERFMGFGF